jgi:hypothetical protein
LEIDLYPVDDVLLVLCLTIGAVVLINVGIIVAFRRGGSKKASPYKTFGKAINVARNPWKKENEQMNELSSILDSIEENSDQGE